MQSKEDRIALLKLAQMFRFLYSRKFTERICSKEGSNNFQLSNHVIKKSISNYLGKTILHIVASQYNEPQTLNCKAIDILLNNGADFTIKDQAGFTALRDILNQCPYALFLHKFYESFHFSGHENLRLLLAAHIKFNNFSNPCDNDGMSHFHIACIFNIVEVIEFFLKNGVPIDHSVNVDSEHYAGYTPLHFAVKFLHQEVIETLLKHGANTCAKDARGMTPLHILIELKMCTYDSINKISERKSDSPSDDLTNKIERIERMVDLFLQKNSIDNAAFFDNVGLSRVHIACTMQDSSQVETLLDHIMDIYHAVPETSSIWPGYTALHFAANCNVETVKILMKRGANIEAKDANGVTPFDICVSKHKIRDICTIVSYKLEWKYIQFSYSKIKLIDLLAAMENSNRLGKFLKNQDVNVSISNNAPLWPGYTPLHLAVIFSGRFDLELGYKLIELLPSLPGELYPSFYPLIEECLSRGADVAAQDARGSTPLHLAFKLKRSTVVKRLLNSHYKSKNPEDEEGLSHLQIACAVGDCEVVEKLVNEQNVSGAFGGKTVFYGNSESIKHGDTPLHIAVAAGNVEVVRILLKSGADVNKSDAIGRTPVHIAPLTSSEIALELLSSPNLKICAIPGVNFSHLHVACRFKSVDAVKKLIGLGADVNAAIVYKKESDTNFLSRQKGWMPLHFAAEVGDFEIAKLLIQNGADIFVRAKRYDVLGKDVDDFIPMSIVVEREKEFGDNSDDLLELFARIIENDESLQQRMEKDFGITMLHLWCYLIDLESIQTLLKNRKADVNARVREDSPMWPGCTPMHVLIVEINNWNLEPQTEKNANKIFQLLLNEGADVTLADVKRDTPLHLSFKCHKVSSKKARSGMSYSSQIEFPKRSRAKMLMKNHKDFNVNPVNEEGISHFHIAVAIDDLDVATEFLQKKVDVNQATKYFNSCAAGYTALHYAVDALAHKTFKGSPEYPMVELLLSHGADANVEDIFGNTPLHLAVRAKAPRDDLLKMLARHGAEINKKNLNLQTPFELMLSDDDK